MRPDICWLFLAGWLFVPAAIAEVSPAQAVRTLETGKPAQWPNAIRQITEQAKYIPSLALSSVLYRLPFLAASERLQIAESLNGYGCEPRPLGALADLVLDKDDKVKKAAEYQLFQCSKQSARDFFLHTTTPDHPLRGKLVTRLAQLYLQERESGQEGKDYSTWQAVQEAGQGAREETYLPVILPLAEDPDPAVRKAVAEALKYFADVRMDGQLFRLTKDPDRKVRRAAQWSLASRGDERVFKPLLEWTKTRKQRSRWHRDRHFERLGAAFDYSNLLGYPAIYKSARTEDERRDYRYLINGALGSGILDRPEIMAGLERWLDDENEFIRDTGRKVLSWRDNRKRKELKEKLGDSLPAGLLFAAAGLSGLFGLVMFAWAFRLLRLWYLAHGLPPASLRSMAVGQVAVKGRLQAATGYIRHPMTGDLCLFYGGADRDHPDHRLYLEDKTGRVLIDPRGAVLLSTEGMLVPGEEVYVLSNAEPADTTGPDRRVLNKNHEPRNWQRSLLHFVVRRLMGGNARGGAARMLFSDPRTAFWIWGETRKPLSSVWELAVMFFAVLLSGYWLMVFATTGLATVNQESAVVLKQLLGL
ncbi:MAG: HEAT repeat domain-containing protein [Gammaproteobacteria bacterium]|nr:HEAT repeat domain-containing protein [Gammaproteobacteria bacterium]